MSSPPEFIVSVSHQLGLGFEEIRQAKRGIESQALVDKLDSAIFSLLNIDHSNTARYPTKCSRYQTVATLLCRNGYRRPWFHSVRERLFSLTWLSIVTCSWRTRACESLITAAQSALFPNIASLYIETFFDTTSHAQVMHIPRIIPFSAPNPSNDPKNNVTSLAKRKNRINQMLRLLKQLDITRARLQAKITAKVQSTNASYRRPLTNQDKQNITRNLSLLPLALSVQPKEALSPAATSQSHTKKKISRLKTAASVTSHHNTQLNNAAALEHESLHYNKTKKSLSTTMEHEGTFYRWVEKAVSEVDEQAARRDHSSKPQVPSLTPAVVPEAVQVLSKEISQSVEMLALLEDAVGLCFVNSRLCTQVDAPAQDRASSKQLVSFPKIFAQANHDMEMCAGSDAFALDMPEEDQSINGSMQQVSDRMARILTRKSDLLSLHGECAGAQARGDLLEELLRKTALLPLSPVSHEALTSLRAKNINMLGRAAQACDRYCPYEFSVT